MWIDVLVFLMLWLGKFYVSIFDHYYSDALHFFNCYVV